MTGDVATRNADGYYCVVDRKKDMIIVSGYKVWPREVEDTLYGHAAVKEAAVIGVKDDYRGETVKAFVSLKPGTTATEQEPHRVLQTEDRRSTSASAQRRDRRRGTEDGHRQSS